MRCYYMSDLHLETQAFDMPLPEGDVLILAGDVCNACCLDPVRTDRFAVTQRARVERFVARAVKNFAHVIAIAGNHEHYDGFFAETVPLLRAHFPGVTVLDNEAVEIGGVRFFGSTLWTDFEGGNAEVMQSFRRAIGDYFFIKTADGRFQPEDAFALHQAAWNRLCATVSTEPAKPTVVITHHSPSGLGLSSRFAQSRHDAAYASMLDRHLETFENVPVWIHGHTHVARTYEVGRTEVRSNARGFVSRGEQVPGFSAKAHFEI